MSLESKSTLELDSPQNVRLQRREVFVEKIGWLVMAAAILAALAGLAGPGPLSSRTVSSSESGVRVDYDAIVRYEAPAELVIHFDKLALGSQRIEVAVSRSWTNHVTVETIAPRPLAEELAAENVIYVFQAADVQSAGSVVFRYKHDSYGPLQFTVGLPGADALSIHQFILP